MTIALRLVRLNVLCLGCSIPGDDPDQSRVFSYLSLTERIAANHAPRGVRPWVAEVLRGLSRRFDSLYARIGRPSILPERLLLQRFYSVRGERLLVEQVNCNLLPRSFEGLEADREAWNHAVWN